MATQRLCAACSNKLLTSFATTFGARIRPSAIPTRHTRLGVTALSARTFHHTRVRLELASTSTTSESISEALAGAPKADALVEEELGAAETTTEPIAETATEEAVIEAEAEAPQDDAPKVEAVPWFLRVETPKAPRHPLADKDVLPELPENPTAELQELLTQLSEDHGITGLNILDMRPLDPPPALGAGIIMLVGTARSVRHLHATADKVCRYMRSKYKWSPFADGLLGRNELRLINRRKQRRGKVVSTQLGEVDEAGSSGWVCVHGGDGKIVVQLFTQAKRDEMDIDTMWRAILERDARHRIAETGRQAARDEQWAKEQEWAEAKARVEEEQEVVREENVVDTIVDEIQPVHTLYNTLPSVSGPFVQKRSLHQLTSSTPAPETDIPSNVTSAFSEFTDELSEYLTGISTAPKEASGIEVLQGLIDVLKSPMIPTASLLGTGPADQSSTPFLNTFYEALKHESVSEAQRVKYELELLTIGNTHKPDEYHVDKFLPFLNSMRESGKRIGPEHIYMILSHLAVCAQLRSPYEGKPQERADERISFMSQFIGNLKEHTSIEEAGDIHMRPEFRYAKFQAFLDEPVAAARQIIINHDMSTGELPELRFTQIFGEHEVHPWIYKHGNYSSMAETGPYAYTLKEHHLDMLTLLALAGRWERLWELWKRLPLMGVTRTAEYYKLVYVLVVMKGSQKDAIYCARMLGLTSLGRERPEVNLQSCGLAAAFIKLTDLANRGKDSIEWNGARALCEEKMPGEKNQSDVV